MICSMAPLDLAYELPVDWKEGIGSLNAEPAMNSFLQVLKKAVRKYGDSSLLIQKVQWLATYPDVLDQELEGPMRHPEARVR